MTQAACAAGRKKNSYFSAQLRRLASRRGRKRALVAVAHSLIVVVYHMLKTGTPYRDLGPEYLDRLEPHRMIKILVRRLESLGQDVTLHPRAVA